MAYVVALVGTAGMQGWKRLGGAQWALAWGVQQGYSAADRTVQRVAHHVQAVCSVAKLADGCVQGWAVHSGRWPGCAGLCAGQALCAAQSADRLDGCAGVSAPCAAVQQAVQGVRTDWWVRVVTRKSFDRSAA